MLTVEVSKRHDEADVEENREGEESNDAYPEHIILKKHAPHLKQNFANCRFSKSRIRVWLRETGQQYIKLSINRRRLARKLAENPHSAD